MNNPNEKLVPGRTQKPVQDPDRTIPARDPAKSSPQPARGNDDVMSQQEKSS